MLDRISRYVCSISLALYADLTLSNQFIIMFNPQKRPLSSLSLPPGTLPRLTQNGFQFVEDLLEMSPERLQTGLSLCM